jgi:hypothetical protein
VQTRLADHIPPGDTRLAAHDAAQESADFRRGTRERGWRTTRQYQRWLGHYQAWCRATGRQPDLEFLTDRLADDWVASLIVDTEERQRYSPASVKQAIAALKAWAVAANVDPLPSFVEARNRRLRYVDALAELGVVSGRQDARIRPLPRG